MIPCQIILAGQIGYAKESCCEEPNFVETVSLDRTSLTLYIGNNEGLENLDVQENVRENGTDVRENVQENSGDVRENTHLNGTEQNVYELIKADNSLSARAISTMLDVASKTVERAIKKLKDLGYIQREGSDKKGTWKVLK